MEIVVDLLKEVAKAVESGINIRRESKRDKEFHFQDWFQNRLNAINVAFDPPGRHAYPDFRLIEYPIGFEVKGLGFPGREANFDCNSQIPTGNHNKRIVFYAFGRYPSEDVGEDLCVYDLILCHGDFLNSDHDYIHKNKNVRGFGSYGDIMIRDRKMYVCPTPFALTKGTKRQVTLILPEDYIMEDEELSLVGKLERQESKELIVGYSFDLTTNDLVAKKEKNPNNGKINSFNAYKLKQFKSQKVEMNP